MRFDYFEPSTLEEARELLRRGNGDYKALAGGTDIIIQLRRGMRSYRGLVNVKRLPGIGTWALEKGKGLRIGAAALMRELEMSPAVAERFPSLTDALKVVGCLQLRNIATVGGNLCNASPSADTAPPLMVLGATATFVNNGSAQQSLPVEGFFTGPGSTVLGLDGLLLQVEVPEPREASGDCFQRLTPRGAMDIAVVSAASRVDLDPAGRKVKDVAIALGAVAPTPIRAPRAENLLRGNAPTPELLAEAGNVAQGECCPIDDIRGTAAYRKAMVAVMVKRTLEIAIERARAKTGRERG